MDDLNALMGSLNNRDLTDKLLHLLDRQADHKLTPHFLLGFLGLFNLLSIVSLIHGNVGTGIRPVADQAVGGASQGSEIADTLTGLMKSQGAGQPEIMSLLGNMAAKKKINPSLLLSLMSLLGTQSIGSAPQQSGPPVDIPADENAAVSEGKNDRSSSDKHGVELKYDRKK